MRLPLRETLLAVPRLEQDPRVDALLCAGDLCRLERCAVLDLLHDASGERQVALSSQEDDLRVCAEPRLESVTDRPVCLDPGAVPA